MNFQNHISEKLKKGTSAGESNEVLNWEKPIGIYPTKDQSFPVENDTGLLMSKFKASEGYESLIINLVDHWDKEHFTRGYSDHPPVFSRQELAVIAASYFFMDVARSVRAELVPKNLEEDALMSLGTIYVERIKHFVASSPQAFLNFIIDQFRLNTSPDEFRAMLDSWTHI